MREALDVSELGYQKLCKQFLKEIKKQSNIETPFINKTLKKSYNKNLQKGRTT